MQLKYHQISYDLLTQQPIDPHKRIQDYTEYAEIMKKSEIDSGHDKDATEQKYAKQLSDTLAWAHLDLYQRPVQFSQENVLHLERLEREYQVTIPASVREWYSLDIAPDIMTVRGWAEIGLAGIRPASAVFSTEDTHRFPSDMWIFLHDEYYNQGGEFIAFRMNVSDDPPVFAEIGTDLYPIASTFSEFIRVHFWDWLVEATFPHQITLWSPYGVAPISEKYHVPIARLQQHFQQVPTTSQLRFYSSDVYIRVFQRNLPTAHTETLSLPETMVEGRVHARTLPALKNALLLIWDDDIPAFDFHPFWEDKDSALLLEELQKGQLLKLFRQTGDWIKARDIPQHLGYTDQFLKGIFRRPLLALIKNGDLEAHPDNHDTELSDNLYRIRL